MKRHTPRRRIERIIWELGGSVEVAHALGVSRYTVRHWIKTDRLPPERQTQLLAHIEAVSAPVDVRDLIGG